MREIASYHDLLRSVRTKLGLRRKSCRTHLPKIRPIGCAAAALQVPRARGDCTAGTGLAPQPTTGPSNAAPDEPSARRQRTNAKGANALIGK